jgi:hypothetical protein
MKEIAARVTRMSESEVSELVYRAAESFVAFPGLGEDWFEIRQFPAPGAANWLCYQCRHVLDDFDFAVDTKKSFLGATVHAVCGRIRRVAGSPMLPKPRALPSPTLISLKERVAGIGLHALEREMETFLQTADFSTGRALFRDGIALGPARCVQWMIDYAFACDDVHAEYARTSLMSETYQVFVSIQRSECKFSSFS